MSYEFVGQISRDIHAELYDISQHCEWKTVKDEEKNFQTCFIDPPILPIAKDINSAFFLKIPPGGKVHRHVDVGDKKTYHVVITTNDDCVNYMENGQIEAYRLKAGDIYEVDRSKAHWSENYGDTDRIHLLLEVNG